MSIKVIVFENVQPHRETTLNLHPGLNIIKAVSDTGKSSLERGFESAVTGSPRPLDLLNFDVDPNSSVRIAMEFEEGTWVAREQSEKVNQYETSESSKPYKALRGKVPEEVQSLMNMDSVNVHNQDDPYFMLASSPADVGRKLSEAVGLEIIDITTKESRAYISKIRGDLKYTKADAKSIKEVLKGYEDLDELEPKILNVQKLFDNLDSKFTIINSLSSLVEETSRVEVLIDRLKGQMKAGKSIEDIAYRIKKLQRRQTQIDNLSHLILSINQLEITIGKQKEQLKVKKKLEAIKEKALNTASLAQNINKLSYVVSDTEMTEKLGSELAESYLSALSRYVKRLEQEKICPICASSIDKSVINRIEERMSIK